MDHIKKTRPSFKARRISNKKNFGDKENNEKLEGKYYTSFSTIEQATKNSNDF